MSLCMLIHLIDSSQSFSLAQLEGLYYYHFGYMSKKNTLVTALLAASILAVAVSLGYMGFRALQPVRISLELSEKAPLSAMARVDTREESEVSLRIRGRDGKDLRVTFSGLSRRHEVPILGLYPDYKNEVEFKVRTGGGDVYTRSRTIRTEPLPSYYPDVKVERHIPDKISPGMIFMHLGYYDEEGDFHPLPSAIDEYGRVRWYYKEEIGHVLERLENGNFLVERRNEAVGKGEFEGEGDELIEIDLLGRTVRVRGEVQTGLHHDVALMPNGNILALSSAPDSYDDGVVEIDAETGEVVQGWDFREILDPNRPRQPLNLEETDWLHLNGIDYNPSDDSFVVSGRDQSAVVKVHRESGELQWILGNHEHWPLSLQEHLLDPAGSDEAGSNDASSESSFQWQWGQHAPSFHPENPRRVLLYDNGNERSYENPLTPKDNYSRAVEYEVDPEAMEVRQIWEFGRRYGSELFTPFIGDARYLPNGNRLICFGGITRSLEGEPMELFDFENNEVHTMKISARIIETDSSMPAREVLSVYLEDPDPESYRGYRSYRAEKLPMYPESLVE
ncbi:MAG: aryl-sulfate sulfotransferase [Spirochaetaceae bacterium]